MNNLLFFDVKNYNCKKCLNYFNNKIMIIIFLLLNVTLSLYAQSEADKEKAQKICMEAVELIDNGEYDKSIELLKESVKLDPFSHIYLYEMGLAYYLKKDFENSIECFKKTININDVNDQCYQMLGNAYDMNKQPEKAIETYNAGLSVFPNSGRLYLELGNMYKKDLNKALEYYEKGIEVEPTFPSNYYWASRLFCSSEEEMWGLLYGEIFMNLERGSKRTEEISKLLYETYKKGFIFETDTSGALSFCQNQVLNKIDPNILPFTMVYEFSLGTGISYKKINLENLNKIRKASVDFFYGNKHNESYKNIVFKWHKSLIDKDFFECYNYWILMQGDYEEFEKWYGNNQEKFDKFIEWFKDNPMQIDNEHKFHRFDY